MKESYFKILYKHCFFIALSGIGLVSCNSSKAIEAVREEKSEAASKITQGVEKQNRTSYMDEIIKHVFRAKDDPSIEFVAAESGDNSFLIFNEIPGSGPYFLETRRLLQPDIDVYISAVEAQEVLNGLDGMKVPFGVMMPVQQYLPGEIVSWRIRSSDGKVLKEATCCPNPKTIVDKSGKCLMEAALLNHPNTVYMLFFPPSRDAIDYTFTCGQKQSKGTIPAGKFEYTSFEPTIEGVLSGNSLIEISTNGETYQIEMPWGKWK